MTISSKGQSSGEGSAAMPKGTVKNVSGGDKIQKATNATASDTNR